MRFSILLATVIGTGSLALAHDCFDARADAGVQVSSPDPTFQKLRQVQPDTARPREFPDGMAWTIEGGLAWGIGLSDAVVFVPHGFVHDRGGVPPILWRLASYTRAAVVHDYLYWAQPCSRLQADNLLMIAMKESGVPWPKRQMVYLGVRLQGASVWQRNADERAVGLPRFNPYGYVPENMTWPQLRTRMFHEGIRDVHYLVPDDYCRYGDSQEVP